MSTAEAQKYLKRAAECERLAGACISESNRNILLYAAASWRILANETVGASVPEQQRPPRPLHQAR
jgi:hypothetical protein